MLECFKRWLCAFFIGRAKLIITCVVLADSKPAGLFTATDSFVETYHKHVSCTALLRDTCAIPAETGN